MQARKALGKGLASLIPSEAVIKVEKNGMSSVQFADVNSIFPNRLQPRENFSEESIKNLAESIRANGIIQPLIVTPPIDGRYELIAGERRLRAARLAGIDKVPILVREANQEMMLELALIENIQREDLNPIEEAKAYKEMADVFGYTQEEIAERVSKSRSHIANTLRLLFLPKVIQEDVVVGRMSPGHARTLLAISDLSEQLKIREHILHANMTVRDLELYIQTRMAAGERKTRLGQKKTEISPQIRAVQNEMTEALGTKVIIRPRKNKKGGQVVIEYYSAQDLNNIYKKITIGLDRHGQF